MYILHYYKTVTFTSLEQRNKLMFIRITTQSVQVVPSLHYFSVFLAQSIAVYS